MALPALTDWPATEFLARVKDSLGKSGTFRAWLAGLVSDPDAAGPADIKSKLAAVVDALITTIQLIARADRTDTPDIADWASTPYTSALDKASFDFVASDGTHMKIALPTPLAAILDSIDKTKIDMVNSDVKAFTDYVKANCVTEEGTPLTDASVNQAYRTRPSGRKFPLGRG